MTLSAKELIDLLEYVQEILAEKEKKTTDALEEIFTYMDTIADQIHHLKLSVENRETAETKEKPFGSS